MTVQARIQMQYTVNTRAEQPAGVYRVSYSPRGLAHTVASREQKKMPECVAVVNVVDESVRWDKPPVDADVTPEELAADALRRATSVHGWLTMLIGLLGSVWKWANDLGWSGKRIEKPMDDTEIGTYFAPALLLQEGTTKVLLEPIARSAPGAEGVVDLYLMPGYDDIASLYYHGNRWHVHYISPEQKTTGKTRGVEAKPLTKASLKRVLEEMEAHAE